MKPIPAHYELVAAQHEYADLLLDIYAMCDDGEIVLAAVCLSGSKFDLLDVVSEAARDHFSGVVDEWDPSAEARHERGMERAAGILLGCCVE